MTAPLSIIEDAFLTYLGDADGDTWLTMQVALAAGVEVVEVEPGECLLIVPDSVRLGPLGLAIGDARQSIRLALRFAGDAVAKLAEERPEFIEPAPREPTDEERHRAGVDRLRFVVDSLNSGRRAEEAARSREEGRRRPDGLATRLRRSWRVLAGLED